MILGIDVAFIHTPHRVGPTFFDLNGNWMLWSQRNGGGEGE